MQLPGGTYYYPPLNWTIYLLETAIAMQGRMITGETRTGLGRYLYHLPSILMNTVLLLRFSTSATELWLWSEKHAPKGRPLGVAPFLQTFCSGACHSNAKRHLLLSTSKLDVVFEALI
ncbi:hypothetical protein AMECASPLE_036044 [Ameca splendens]|uniref:Uncharacterized protein n=1 Tax=Ameca splendens TaxID=208324 RepID=A0ABV0Z6C5_9TELE